MTESPDTDLLFLSLTQCQIKEALLTLPDQAITGLFQLDHVEVDHDYWRDVVTVATIGWVEKYWTVRERFDDIIRDFEEPT